MDILDRSPSFLMIISNTGKTYVAVLTYVYSVALCTNSDTGETSAHKVRKQGSVPLYDFNFIPVLHCIHALLIIKKSKL